jgi:hypothetical protein
VHLPYPALADFFDDAGVAEGATDEVSHCQGSQRAYGIAALRLLRDSEGPLKDAHGKGCPRVVDSNRREDTVHRARESVGERIYRVIQWEASRRATERRNLFHPEGGEGAGRKMETGVQHQAPSQLAGVSAAGTGNHRDRTSPRGGPIASTLGFGC